MKNSKQTLCIALLGTLLISAPQAAHSDSHTNPLKDPSFEQQLAPDQGGWILFKESMFSAAEARTGSQSIFNWGFSRTVPFPPFLLGAVSGSYQEFSADPGSRWQLTGFGVAPTAIEGTPAFGIIQVSFFDASGEDLGTVETADNKSAQAKTSNEVNSQTPAGEWVFLDTGIATAPEGTATVQAFTLFVDFSDSETSQGVYFDDLSLCALEDDGAESACKKVD